MTRFDFNSLKNPSVAYDPQTGMITGACKDSNEDGKEDFAKIANRSALKDWTKYDEDRKRGDHGVANRHASTASYMAGRAVELSDKDGGKLSSKAKDAKTHTDEAEKASRSAKTPQQHLYAASLHERAQSAHTNMWGENQSSAYKKGDTAFMHREASNSHRQAGLEHMKLAKS